MARSGERKDNTSDSLAHFIMLPHKFIRINHAVFLRWVLSSENGLVFIMRLSTWKAH